MTDPTDRAAPPSGHADLTPAERSQASALEQAIDDTAAFVRSRPAPDFTAAVMRTIEQEDLRPAGAWGVAVRGAAAALWNGREVSFRLRPAYGLAAVALVALAVYLPLRPADSPSAPPQLFVQFRLEAPGASDVRIAGSFSGWELRHQMYETAPGVWTVTLPLTHGVHDYAFLVDGSQWVADPYAQRINDGFGGINSRIALLPPDPPQT